MFIYFRGWGETALCFYFFFLSSESSLVLLEMERRDTVTHFLPTIGVKVIGNSWDGTLQIEHQWARKVLIDS